jgi:hypothetical protein
MMQAAPRPQGLLMTEIVMFIIALMAFLDFMRKNKS